MLYETAQEYRVGATIQRRLRLARIGREGLEQPEGGDGPMSEGSEGPAVAWDDEGRLWIAWLDPSGAKGSGWTVRLSAWTGGSWLPPLRVSSAKGMDRPPDLVVNGHEVLLLRQWDNMPPSWTNEAVADASRSAISLEAFDPGSLPAPDPAGWRPLEESGKPFTPAQLRADRGEDRTGWTITHAGRDYRLFFGDLHEHTDDSPCGRERDRSIDESDQHMRNLAVHDFACVTDHGYGLNSYLWHMTAKPARINEDPGRFLTFLGEE